MDAAPPYGCKHECQKLPLGPGTSAVELHKLRLRNFRATAVCPCNRNLGNSSAEVPGPNGSFWHSVSGNTGLMLQFLWRHAYVFGRVPAA